MDERPYGFLDKPGYVFALGDGAVIGGVGPTEYNLNEINTINFKIDLTSQVNKFNQVQAGFEFIYDDYKIETGEQNIGDPTGNFDNKWSRNPYRIQGYIQDKLEFQDFIANLGVRMDYNQMNSPWYGVDPYNKYFTRCQNGL
jgi:hypothetical protein